MLRERGLDAQAVVERAEARQASDLEILETAAHEQRAVVTNNIKDFRPLAAELIAEGRDHMGLILLPAAHSRGHDATGAVADAIEKVMRAHPEGIVSTEHWIARLR